MGWDFETDPEIQDCPPAWPRHGSRCADVLTAAADDGEDGHA